jgi:hypothetical protein
MQDIYYYVAQLALSPQTQLRIGVTTRTANLKTFIDENKNKEDFNLESVLKGIDDMKDNLKHLTEKEKDEIKELKIGLEKELKDQYFSRLENELNNPNTEDKKALILRAIVDHVSNDPKNKSFFEGKDDINNDFLDLMKKDPKVLDDFKKLCNEFKDRPVAEIAERLPESNLFMRICHYIQNLFQNTLRGKVKETKKSFVKALENEKLKPRQSQAFNNTL